ncbi:hypothetical protein [Variovorax ginsengisoli]|uniref:Uncharacterized protein n=1 Tax=Variovorax ginsengisoli TaxID=363844 RepID=A0ABT8SFK2_9BURK|nr:hypothetical protein [Variovorax ginsengisoli]MDN8617983.1 hypothetical protein [Variovorax ginsengisoli]MDO1537153.1 hypothetical protein [Variovorax ginsengisoli]
MHDWISSIDPKQLDFWRTVATVVASAMAVVVTGVIQYRQWRLGKDKLAFDLFDRRMEAWEAVRALSDAGDEADLMMRGAWLTKRRQDLRKAAEAPYLFGSRIAGPITELLNVNEAAIVLAPTNAVSDYKDFHSALRDLDDWRHQHFRALEVEVARSLQLVR